MKSTTIRCYRIDVPLLTTSSYFFIMPKYAEEHPWWGTLIEWLGKKIPPDEEWVHDESSHRYLARPRLTAADRLELFWLLKTAPAALIEANAPLRRANSTPAERVSRFELVFFADEIP